MEKQVILLCLAFGASLAAHPQSAPQNYRETVTLLDRMTDGEYWDAVHDHTDINARRSRTYYDGMGKPVEESCDATGLSGKPTVCRMEYDTQGRISKTWQRLPAPNGLQHTTSSAVSATAAAFFGDQYAYSQNTHDALGRLTSATPAGAEWHGKGKAVTVSYDTNAENEVKWYKAPMEKVSLVPSGYYPAGTLSRETTTDEDGRTTSVYKDLMGSKVLERRGQTNDTYYVYNDMGQLRYVLSPEYQKSGYKNLYAYEYRYDVKGRVVKKILPGCEYTQYWYDDADRVAFMQDAKLREKGLYRFFVYDLFGRTAMQGTCASCNRQEHAATAVYRKAADGFLQTGYELTQPESIGEARLEMVNYYDDYDFLRLGGNYAGALCDSLRLEGHESAKGYKTGSLEYTSGGSAMLEAFYLDLRGNIVASRRAWGGRRLTATDTEYTFTNGLKSRSVREYALTSTGLARTAWHTIENVYGKRNGALEATRLTLTDANGSQRTQTIKTYTYDDAGRLQSVARGGSAGSVSYAYNLKGWPTRIDSNEFHEELRYTDGDGAPCYSGDISSMLWRASDYPEARGYKFTYDSLDRLTEAVYGEGGGLSDKQNRYNEKVVEYTANGAMKRFQRRGRKDNGEYGKIDNLNIKLRGNQLLSAPMTRCRRTSTRRSTSSTGQTRTPNMNTMALAL